MRSSRAARRMGRGAANCGGQLVLGDPPLVGVLFRGPGDVEDVRALEIAALGDAVVAHYQVGVITKQQAQIIRRPDEELALNALAVGVLRRVETAGPDRSSRAARNRGSPR